MTKQSGKLAAALAHLKTLQVKGFQAASGRMLPRPQREALLRAGFLKQVIRGWYIPSRPDEAEGDSTSWYASMREFVTGYANQRFEDRWHVNPELSIQLRSGERTVPKQIQIWATSGNNQSVALPHDCSLFIYRAPKLLPFSPAPDCGGLHLVEFSNALVSASPTLFIQTPIALQIALTSLPDPSDVLRILLEGSNTVVAGRLAGAFRCVGRADAADQILGAMRAAGHAVNEVNPFEKPLATPLPGGRSESPYVTRLRLMWAEMRDAVKAVFPPAPGTPGDLDALLRDVESRYVTDAYHSLSIEGYRVTASLIEKVRDANWNPDSDEADHRTRDAMAARGYSEAHNLVKEYLIRAIKGEAPAALFREALARWYQALFSPSVQAGILKPADLAGYRNDQVFIRGALHVPLSKESVRECMPVLFELIENEPEPQVRAVLGHFLFVYIHPYMDGNGRLARFLMNFMLASAGYVWTVIPVTHRKQYMDALEQASSFRNIEPFATLLSGLMQEQTARPLPNPHTE